MRQLPVVPPPIPNEWLGHWLLRVADRYGMRIGPFLVRLPRFPKAPTSLPWSARVDWTLEQWDALAFATRHTRHDLFGMQTRLTPNAMGIQGAYCRDCLAEDISVGRSPYWRRHWMDASYTWCGIHDCPLVGRPPLAQIGQQNLSALIQTLKTLATAKPILSEPTYWWSELAASSGDLARATQNMAAANVALLGELINAIVDCILQVFRDPEAVTALLPLINVRWRDDLALESLKLVSAKRGSPIGQIRSLSQRTWMMGLASRIAQFTSPRAAEASPFRAWLWQHLYVTSAPRLVRAVWAVRPLAIIIPWPAVERWRAPESAAEWFRRGT